MLKFLQSLEIVEILRVGLAGLCFLLSVLSFYLIYREQGRDGAPRKGILRAIYTFMSVNFFVAILVAVSAYLTPTENRTLSQQHQKALTELAAVRTSNEKYRETLIELSTLINNKVRNEQEALRAGYRYPAISIAIEQLSEAVQRARQDGLLDR